MSDFIESYRLIDRIQDSNINFLFGSGMSAGYLEILGNIENLLTELDKEIFEDQKQKDLIRASILNKYFEGVIDKNKYILDSSSLEDDFPEIVLQIIWTLESYKTFFKTINQLISLRRNKLLSKQVNIFTTNIDIFLERAIEQVGLESNDGFGKGFKPKYDLSNFKKSIFQKSLHFDNSSEIPVFNILKIHGSLTWERENEHIYFDNSLEQIKKVQTTRRNSLLNVDISKDTVATLKTKLPKRIHIRNFSTFLEEYDKLSIVNPTKGKFQQTVLDQKYYDLLRIYANELERENTLLFVMGFSFADEHIRDLTIRVANSNPTLMIYVFAFDKKSRRCLNLVLGIFKNKIKNNNIKIIYPDRIKVENKYKDEFQYTFDQINERIFKPILEKISKPISKKVFKATLKGFGNE